MNGTVVWGAAAWILAAAASTAGATEVERNFLRSFPAPPGTRFHLVHGDGNVTVVPWDRDSLEVTVRYHASVTEIGIGDEADYTVDFRQDGKTVHVIGREKPDFTVGILTVKVHRHEFEIHAPAGTPLDLEGEDGDVTVTGWAGELAIQGEDGQVTLRDVAAPEVRVHVEDGSILLDQVRAAVFVDGEDADVSVDDSRLSKGRFRLEDGDLTLREAEGNLDVELEDGGLRATRVRLRSSSIRTADGDVELDLLDGAELDLDVTTVDGSVRVHLDPGAALAFTARSQNGGVRVDLPGADLSQADEGHAEGVWHGGGGSLRIKTDGGRVEIRRRAGDPD